MIPDSSHWKTGTAMPKCLQLQDLARLNYPGFSSKYFPKYEYVFEHLRSETVSVYNDFIKLLCFSYLFKKVEFRCEI